MAADDTTDVTSGAGKRADSMTPTKTVSKRRTPVRAGEGHVGQTLRTVYQQTVNEDIPADLLDLLGKLA